MSNSEKRSLGTDVERVCILCDRQFGLLETRYTVRKAVKPLYTPNRYVVVGYVCEPCSEGYI